jgi:hypothetical protein
MRSKRKKQVNAPVGSKPKALSKGGTNKDGVTVEDRSKNRSRNYKKK